MQMDGCTYARLLRACRHVNEGKRVHLHISNHAPQLEVPLSRELVQMYLTCGNLPEAHAVLSKMPEKKNVALWTSQIAAFSEDNQFSISFQMFQLMHLEGVNIDRVAFITMVNACTRAGAWKQGRLVHKQVDESGLKVDTVLGTAIVNMYGKCGSLQEACLVFEKIELKNVISWTVLVAAFAHWGYYMETYHLLQRMQLEGLLPNKITCINALGACESSEALNHGGMIHDLVVENGLSSDLELGNALLSMYSRCGSADGAMELFKRSSQRDVITWTAVIAAHVEAGLDRTAFSLFQLMQLDGVKPDKVTFVTLLSAKMHTIKQAKLIHKLVVETGMESDIMIGTALVETYARCGDLVSANISFNKIPQQNVACWSALIGANAELDQRTEALLTFQRMLLEGIKPDAVALLSILDACRGPSFRKICQLVHSLVVESGLELDLVLGNALIDMYGNCGDLEAAREMFEQMLKYQDLVSWNSMLAGYSEHGYGEETLLLFRAMGRYGVIPDHITINAILKACSELNSESILRIIFESGLSASEEVQMALLRHFLYSGSIQTCVYENSSNDFAAVDFSQLNPNEMTNRASNENRLSWVDCKEHKDAAQTFNKMLLEGLNLDQVSFINVLKDCSSHAFLAVGELVHPSIVADVPLANALITMYGKHGCIEQAEMVFEAVELRDVVSWNALLGAYNEQDLSQKAFRLFERMQLEGFKPSKATFMSVLSACSSFAAFEEGTQVQDFVKECGLQNDDNIKVSVLKFYGRCGRLEQAKQTFDEIKQKSVVAWNCLVSAYAHNGSSVLALKLFLEMQLEGDVEPDKITFVSVLSACSHTGKVDDGVQQFISMKSDFGIVASSEHHGVMVDLYGRSGRLEDAEAFLEMLPQRTAVDWMMMLGACRVHNDLEKGKRAAENIIKLDPLNSPAYVVLSNICAAWGLWDEAAKLRKLMMDKTIRKEPGKSSIKLNKVVHEFYAKSRLHPQTDEIYTKLHRLMEDIRREGYVPDIKLVLHDVEDEQKEHLLYYHSEKLAIAFGLLSTEDYQPLTIIKNLRICGDCHSATKFISRMAKRKIICRDAKRFHHFANGVCSCADYW